MAPLPKPDSLEVFDPSAPPTDGCPFCIIATTYPTYDPLDPPSAATSHTLTSHLTPRTSSPSPPTSPLDPHRLSPAAFLVLSTPTVLAFLDILPLSQGHLLLCPRTHRPKLTDVSDDESAELGRWLRRLSKALCVATGVHDWNVVQNNGAAAAQVVGHVHYHLIPRPELRASGRLRQSFTMFGKGVREELDDDEAEKFAERMRLCVKDVVEEETSRGKL